MNETGNRSRPWKVHNPATDKTAAFSTDAKAFARARDLVAPLDGSNPARFVVVYDENFEDFNGRWVYKPGETAGQWTSHYETIAEQCEQIRRNAEIAREALARLDERRRQRRNAERRRKYADEKAERERKAALR